MGHYLHHVAASETAARNIACNVSGVDFHSTSAMLPTTISSRVYALKQAYAQITQFIRLSANHVLPFYLQDEIPLTTKITVKKMAASPFTSRLTWKFAEELALIDFYKGK